MKYEYQTGDSAEWRRIIWARFGGEVFGALRITALNLFPEKVFSPDHYNNFKLAILGK